MTLTEEQRGTVGFDLEKARAALEEAIDRMSLTVSDEDGFIWEADPEQTAILQEMLDRIGRYTNNDYLDIQYQLDSADTEIERLRAENLELQVAVFGPDGIRANQACIIVDQAARISDLEIEITGLKADLEQSEEIKRLKDELENYGDHYACLLISKDAQIKELEGMLSIRTEELDIAHSVARSEKEMHEKELAAFARRIKEQDDALVEERAGAIRCESYDHCEGMYIIDLPDAMIRAQQELQAEGKIGPDAETGNRDHVVGPDQMIPNGKCWQITEERVDALGHVCSCLDFFYIPAKTDEVLRAMLAEAGQ